MTDKEKVNDIYDICLEKKSICCNRKMGEETCSKCKTYQMYKLGLAEGRKEKIEKLKTEIESIRQKSVSRRATINCLNARLKSRLEQVERLKGENKELRDKIKEYERSQQNDDIQR